MKRVLALALAVVMTLGLASVAFGATYSVPTFKGLNGNGEITEVYKANSDTGMLEPISLGASNYKQGTTLYIPLKYYGDIWGTAKGAASDEMTSGEMNKYKIAMELNVGADLFKEIKIEYKKFKSAAKYNHVVAIYTNAASNTKLEDVLGTLTLYKTSKKNGEKALLNFAEYGYGGAHLYSTNNVVNTKSTVVSFGKITGSYDACEDETITFDGVGEFEINLANQGKLYLGFNLNFNKEVSALYGDAELEFVNFIGFPAFNKWGTFYLYGEEDGSFVYEINAAGVMSKVDATWDASYDAYRFGAKRLGTFIISDKELDVTKYNTAETDPETAPEDGSAPEEGSKPNPDTGR